MSYFDGTPWQPRDSVRLSRNIDFLCQRFEDEWQAGKRPKIEDYLRQLKPADRNQLAEALRKLQRRLNLSTTVAMRQSQVRLKITRGPHAGQQFHFAQRHTLFAGRRQAANLRLERDSHFSRSHFRLDINPPTCYLIDQGSRNGTYVNGQRVTDCFLKSGDVISGGQTEISVIITGASSGNLLPGHSPPWASARTPTSVLTFDSTDCESVRKTKPSLPGYQVHQEIGEGSLGTLYLATRMTTGETCALKIIKPAVRSDELAVRKFLREASILLTLKHPRIVKFIDLGTQGSDVFLVSEYVESMSWDQLRRQCSIAQWVRLACGLMCQILGALDYAHSMSMVHRDIKPSNILLTRNRGQVSAKLADFGLAKQFTTAGLSQVTQDGEIIGSLPYMSPEQFLNSREARPACDIYSAGATLYWMLTRAEPIPFEHHPCKFLAILEAAPIDIRRHSPAIPVDLARIVHRALEKTPEMRFSSAADMRRQLRRFCR